MDNDLLMKEYLEWYKKNTVTSKIGKASVISTPFTNYIGDRITLYVEPLENGMIRISDDGETLDELEMANLDMTTSTRKKLLANLLKTNGISLEGNILYLEVPRKDFARSKHKLLEMTRQVYDLLFTKRSTIKSLFIDEGLMFMENNDFGGASIIKKSGASGIDYSIDYLLGKTSKRKETLLNFRNNFSFLDFTNQDFIYRDILSTYSSDMNYIIVYNDEENKLSNKIIATSKNSEITLIPWSKKNLLLDYK